MHIKTLFLFCILVLFLPQLLWAQPATQKAQRILSGEEYQGYRVKESRGGESSLLEGDNRSAKPFQRGSGVRRETGPSDFSFFRTGSMFFQGILKILLYVLLFCLGIVLFIFLVRFVRARFRSQKKKEKPALNSIPDSLSEPSFAAQKTQLEEELEHAINSKDYTQALLLLYQLFWVKLGYKEFLSQTSPKTWRDITTTMLSESFHTTIYNLTLFVERFRYGYQEAGAQDCSFLEKNTKDVLKRIQQKTKSS